MIFKHILLDINDTNCYVIACEQTREALLIDPGEYHRDLADFLRKMRLELKFIFITHAHYDHASGLEDILRAFGGKVLVYQPSYFSRAQQVFNGDLIRFGRYTGRVIHTPGHTPDSISLQLPSMVFSGDSLFCGSIGSTNTTADFATLVTTIKKNILSLGDTTIIYPGHGPPTTVAIERLHNPFLIV